MCPVNGDTHAGQFAAQCVTRPGRRIGDEQTGYFAGACPVQNVTRTGNHFVAEINDAVEIKQYSP